MNKTALIAMSGGVDSSAAAHLMKARGFDCVGVTLKLFDNEDIGVADSACCSASDAEDARSVARLLGMPHYVFNFSDDFKAQVIGRFADAYQNGATPNPCIDCNRFIKFERLLDRARQLGMDYVVTGHYSSVEHDAASGRYLLKKAADTSKDQSYVLYAMTQEQLAHTILPLGALHKSEIRELARALGFINANKRDSQDICFVPDGDYAGFIERYTGKNHEYGDFVSTDGRVLGRHRGLARYTVGQRRGVGISSGLPLYVRSKNAQDNTVTLSESGGLFSKALDAGDFNWIAYDNIGSALRVKAKIRYRHTEQWATATPTARDTVHIEFDAPQRAIARGQAVVLYDGEVVVGGGTII